MVAKFTAYVGEATIGTTLLGSVLSRCAGKVLDDGYVSFATAALAGWKSSPAYWRRELGTILLNEAFCLSRCV